MTRGPADGPRRAVGATALRASVTILNVAVILGGSLVLSDHASHPERGAGPPVLPDLHVLTEDMPVDESAVPPLPGTQWGTIVAVPQGGPAPVEPPQCGVFLSQGEVTQKALAM